MDERPEPQRIEIELTSNESDPRGAVAPPASGPDDVVAAGRVEPEPGWLRTERGRLIVSTTCAGILALVVGVLVGRAGSSGGPSADDTTVATLGSATPTSTSPAAVVDTLPPPAAPPTTAVRRRPTTTTLEEAGDGRLVVASSVADLVAEIVVITNRGELLRIEPATGSTTGIDAPGSQFGAPAIHAGDGWILVPSFDGAGGSTVYHDDGTTSTIDVGTSYPILMVAGTDRFWTLEGTDDGSDRPRAVEQSVLTGPTGVELSLTGFPLMLDPLGGGVVVDAPGGSYLVSQAGTTRLTSGRVVALGRTRALAHECDAQLECGFTIIDRTSGDRRPIQQDPAVGEQTMLDAGHWAFADPWNAAEDALLVTLWNQFGRSTPQSGVLDLTTGDFVQIAASSDFSTLQWAPDGRHVFWLDSGVLMVFDRDTEESVDFAEGLGQVLAFTLRSIPAAQSEPAV